MCFLLRIRAFRETGLQDVGLLKGERDLCINTESWIFQCLETDYSLIFNLGAGGEPRGSIQFRLLATAHSFKSCAGTGKKTLPAPQVFTQVKQDGPASTEANVASVGTLDKQENHRIRCVHNNAGSFPQRFTQTDG
tara:strand:- start:83529 stop:83936 length:408 start_codon:yes stop_codon:yes gene_type:complete